MTYKATLKVQFDTEFINHYNYGVNDDDVLPEEHYTFEVPAHDLNTSQLFNFFGTVARAMGHNEIGIMRGACALAFNEMRSTEDMRRVAEEYDLKLKEDITTFDEWKERYWEVNKKSQKEIADLKARLSRFEQPDNPNYTDAEMDAMTAENQVTVETLQNAFVVCHDCGSKYGEYSVGCSSTWEGKCNVCGETKGVTETRDYGYLYKGIQELSK